MESFLKTENKLRIGKFVKNLDDESFLVELNKYLVMLEDTISECSIDNIPNIYIFGLPRSGTTLLYQIFVNCLDVFWPTNLMARFWEAPVIGMKLSKILGLYEQPCEYSSEYGVTSGVNGPHEFGYFWMRWLNYKDNVIREKEHEKTIDWRRLRKKLNSLSSEASKPIVYKNMLYAFHLEKFFELQHNSIFVYCKRDLADIATSILRTREQRYGDKNIWWSFKPPDYKKVLKNDCYDQIVYQVIYGHEYFEKLLSNIRGNNFIVIDYANYNKELDNIFTEISNRKKIKKKARFLPKLKISTYAGSEDYIRFQKKLLFTK